MNKLKIFAALAVLLLATTGLFAQTGASYYVSAQGDNANNGLSEDKPLKSLLWAFMQAASGTIKKITVIGTLNETSEISSSMQKITGVVFVLLSNSEDKNTAEILITGKSGASGSERAVLSAKGSQAGVLFIENDVKVRFEHIEISGGERKPATGSAIKPQG